MNLKIYGVKKFEAANIENHCHLPTLKKTVLIWVQFFINSGCMEIDFVCLKINLGWLEINFCLPEINLGWAVINFG
jgi:hypothetical protein